MSFGPKGKFCPLLIVLVQPGSSGRNLGENLNLHGQSAEHRKEALRFKACVGGEGSQGQNALLTLEELARPTW